jgi:hypothetical protein
VRRSPLRPSRRRLSDLSRVAAAEWTHQVVAWGCKAHPAGGCEGVLQAHHVLYAQHIRAWARTHAYIHHLGPVALAELERRLLWDVRNGMCLCYGAHRRHHNRIEPVPLALVPPAAREFADELGLTYRLEEAYL